MRYLPSLKQGYGHERHQLLLSYIRCYSAGGDVVVGKKRCQLFADVLWIATIAAQHTLGHHTSTAVHAMLSAMLCFLARSPYPARRQRRTLAQCSVE